MSDDDDYRNDTPPKAQWREYTIQLPLDVAKIMERALDDQVAMENRTIGVSEFVCWLVSLGLTVRTQLAKEHKKSQRRIISPGE